MSMFFDSIRDHFANRPDAVAATDERGNVLSYHDFDVLSAKVYAYLHRQGIGKGQLVLILLPRSALIPAAMMGIIRAGAAFIVLEEDAPVERIEYIRADCGCCLTLDSALWEKILLTEPLFAWAEADEHDLLTAAYTSGTTGVPKGVLLERGILDLNSLSSAIVEKTGAFCRGDAIAINFPLNYIVFTICFGFFYMGGTLHILSYPTARDAQAYLAYLHRVKPQVVFLIPSFYKALGHALPPSVRNVFLGGERAESLPVREGRYAVNIYSTTEIGYVCSYCIADGRPGILPLGEQILPDTLRLLDADGKSAAPGEYGEIWARTPYTRGYIGLPEENAGRFSGGYFRTGDIGMETEDGQILCCGRADDMIKINGNRVEPGETAAIFRQITGRKKSFAAGLSDGHHGFLCVYYEGEELADQELVLTEMAKALPSYMLPSFFVRMDVLPKNSNGKIDRSRLPDPGQSAMKKLYLPPADETEAMLCRAFAQVFGLRRVGCLDDFLTLGGSSLMAVEIEMTVDSEYLSAYDLYDCGSILEIAEHIRTRQAEAASMPPQETEPPGDVSFPLLPAQEYYLHWQMNMPHTTMYNLPLLLRFDAGRFDAEKLASAVEAAIRLHPALLTRIYSQNGEHRQSYCPALFCPVRRQKLTEAELTKQLDRFVVPFEIFDQALYRAEIFETEKAVYLFFDVSHLVFDGTSFALLLNDIMRCYRGLPTGGKDSYFLHLAMQEKAVRTERYRKNMEYFQNTYDSTGWSVFPEKDSDRAEKTAGFLSLPLDDLAGKIEVFKVAHKTTSNALFLFISLFAMSFYNGDPKVFMNWLYNCRTERKWMHSIGLFNVELPVKLIFSKDALLSQLLASVNKQITADIAASDCSWGYIDPAESLTFIYQKDIYYNSACKKDGVDFVELPEPLAAASNDFDVEVYDDEDGLSLCLSYDASEYRPESAARFGEIFRAFTEYSVTAQDWDNLTVKDAMKALRRFFPLFS